MTAKQKADKAREQALTEHKAFDLPDPGEKKPRDLFRFEQFEPI